jgi:hypothetical protein
MTTKQETRTFHQRRGLAQFDINKVIVEQNGTNPYFNSKYSTLDDLHTAIQEPLKKHGIYYTFKMCNHAESGRNILKLQIWDMIGKENDTEEFEESCFMLPNESDMQKLGSSLTYASRYLLTGAFLLSVPAFLDDDGNMTSKNPPTKSPSVSSSENRKPTSPRGDEGTQSSNLWWTKDEHNYLNTMLQVTCVANGITKDQFLNRVRARYKDGWGNPIQELEDIHKLKKEVKQKLKSDIEAKFMDIQKSDESPLITSTESETIEDDDIPF